jgi:hypothetical protein
VFYAVILSFSAPEKFEKNNRKTSLKYFDDKTVYKNWQMG